MTFCDVDPAVVEAFRLQFVKHPLIEVREGSILDLDVDAFITPGNSFGFLDGGLSMKVCERFGFGLEDAIRGAIVERYHREMLVGQAEVFPTGGKPPWVVYAPTLRTTRLMGPSMNAYLAARAAFRALLAFNASAQRIGTLAIPGLATGQGKMHAAISARQIRYAYEESFGLRKGRKKNLSRLSRRERKLMQIPGSGAEAAEGGEEEE